MMNQDTKNVFLMRINRALEKRRYAEEAKKKWDEFHFKMEHDMYNIVAYARNVGDELLYNEMFKYEAVEEALTSSLFSMGYTIIYGDDGKAIDIIPFKALNK